MAQSFRCDASVARNHSVRAMSASPEKRRAGEYRIGADRPV